MLGDMKQRTFASDRHIQGESQIGFSLVRVSIWEFQTDESKIRSFAQLISDPKSDKHQKLQYPTEDMIPLLRASAQVVVIWFCSMKMIASNFKFIASKS
jgi:hypothetical protein